MFRHAAVLVFLLAASPLGAQLPGSRVRIDAPGTLATPVAGTLVHASADTISLDAFGSGARLHIPAAAVRRVDSSMGRDRQRWAIIGGLGGALAGGLLGMVAMGRENPGGFGALGGLLGGGLLGGLSGLVAGAAGAPEIWLPHASPGSPVPGDFRLEVMPGSRVRVTLGGPERQRFTGYAAGTTSDTLLLQPKRRAPAISLDLRRLERLQVPGGRARTRGTLIGAGALGTLGLVFGGIDLAHDRMDAATFAGTVLGNAAIGGTLGFLLAPKGWRDVPLPGAHR